MSTFSTREGAGRLRGAPDNLTRSNELNSSKGNIKPQNRKNGKEVVLNSRMIVLKGKYRSSLVGAILYYIEVRQNRVLVNNPSAAGRPRR